MLKGNRPRRISGYNNEYRVCFGDKEGPVVQR